MSWLYLTISSIFLFAGVNITQRLVATKSQDPRVSAVVFNSIAALIAVFISLITGGLRNISLPSHSSAWIGLLFAILFYGLYERGRLHAAQKLDASVMTIIQNLAVAVAFVGSSILYNEMIQASKVLGGSLIICALLIVTHASRRTKQSKSGIILGIIISTILGLGWMLDKSGATHFNASLYNVFVWTLPLVVVIFPKVNIKVLSDTLKQDYKGLSLMAIFNVSGYFLQLKALETAEATLVIPLVQTSSIVTVLLGIFLLNEKSNLKRKLIAGVLAFIGSYIMLS